MPNLLAEKPVPKSAVVQTQSIKIRVSKKKKKMPPGPKLVLRLVAAAGIASLILVTQIGAQRNGNATTKAGKQEIALAPPSISLRYPLDELKSKIELAADMKSLRTGVFAYDAATGKYVDFHGQEEFSAASMIKMPIFVAMYRALDKGEISLDQLVEMRPDLITGGSGWLQWRPPGSKFPLKDVAYLMITNSDNTATNMIIDLLGGKEVLNRSFSEWGLKTTRINNMLGDFSGTNKISPYDMVYLLARIDRGEIISPESRAMMLKT
ncbi:MAG TPA: serine hydrolase, partial [Chroococcales cyanobacterium]